MLVFSLPPAFALILSGSSDSYYPACGQSSGHTDPPRPGRQAAGPAGAIPVGPERLFSRPAARPCFAPCGGPCHSGRSSKRARPPAFSARRGRETARRGIPLSRQASRRRRP